MKSKLLSSFLGGFCGILLSGYVFYLSGKQHFFLVPTGTFLGSLIGFSYYNLKEIATKASKLMQRWHLMDLTKIFQPLTTLLNQALSLFSKIDLPLIGKFFTKTARLIFSPFVFFFKLSNRFYRWLKMHPMNSYRLQEIITLIIIGTALILFFTKSGILQAELSDIKELAIGLLCLSVIASVAMCFVASADSSLENFYADWQFYSRYGLFGVVAKTFSKWLTFSGVVILGFMLIASIAATVVAYAMILLVISLLLIGIIGAITYVIRLAYDHREAAALVITMLVTTVSYFLYQHLFAEELMIWLVAFGTGCASSLAVWLILSLNNGWVLKKLEEIYYFLSNDEAYPEKVSTYHLSWTGVMAFTPGNWIMKKTWLLLDRPSSYLIEAVTLKMR